MMTNADCFISVVAPLYNDGDIIEPFVQDVLAVLSSRYQHFELVLIDDGSEDDTALKIKALLTDYENIRLIRLSRRFGQEIAISAGLDAVIGDFSVVMLPDTDPPDQVPQLIEQARKGAEIVYGIRKSREGEPFLLRKGTEFFYWYCAKILKLNLPKNSTHFRVLSRQVVNAMMQIRDRGRYLRTLSHYVGYANQHFDYETIQRRAKPRRKSLFEAIDLAINIIVANSIHPLRMLSWLGFGVAALNVLYMIYIVAIFLFKDTVAEGWVTTSFQNSVMNLFLFLILALLSEYIGRLLSERQGRPLYYVMDEQTSSTLMSQLDRKNVVTDSLDPWMPEQTPDEQTPAGPSPPRRRAT